MLPEWILEETQDVNLQDRRLNARLQLILEQLSAAPSASLPAACRGRAEMTAAYRFFDNDKVRFENVLEPHVGATRRRMEGQPLVLLVQDTTEIELTRPGAQVRGAGPLDGGARFGAFLHPLMAFTPAGTPLGTVHAQTWVRETESVTNAQRTRSARAQTPITEKESLRWVTTFQAAQEVAAEVPETRCVMVADSEADIYEVLEAALSGTCGYIVRASQNRALVKADSVAATLWEAALAGPVLTTKTVSVRGRQAKIACEKRARRQSRKDRTAAMEVRTATVTLRPPWRPDRKLPVLTVNVVLATEVDPPPDEPAIEWLLLTSEPIGAVDDALQVLEHYSVRWMIEVFFRVLKSGCRVEERRFENLERVLPMLALALIVGWRTLFLCHLGRAFPDLDCETLLEPSEWKAVYRIVIGKPPPKTPPPLGKMIKLIARLGGYIERPGSPPGPQTLWLGLQRAHDMALCWDTFGPDATNRPDV